MIARFSSRTQRLDRVFLQEKLRGARSYKRIAGYFRSSIFELVGEEVDGIPDVKIVCNSELDASDIAVSKLARDAALKEKWSETSTEVDALLEPERYRRLYDLLTRGNVEIRVVPKDRIFVHGKAGVIETPAGKTSFLGSINETRSAFAHNYEILWEDSSPEGVAWVEAEFAALWQDALPLPDAIVTELKRLADRAEISVQGAVPGEVPGAAIAETPLYRGGEQLQPWQRSFVAMFLEHRERYGKARLLLADEVGLGKTLSLAGAALVSALLGDGAVLVLAPSTLTRQWQTELINHLGIPSAVWSSSDKVWLAPDGRAVSPAGAAEVASSPYRVAIVSTGLISHGGAECQHLLARRYGMVILDEAHKARRRHGLGGDHEPNKLLAFMLKLAPKTRHLLLGTATPIQTDPSELWDLMHVLHEGADFVLGRLGSSWTDFASVSDLLRGARAPADLKEVWELVRNPLPPKEESSLFAALRMRLGIDDDVHVSDEGFGQLDGTTKNLLEQMEDDGFFRSFNPMLRHVVLRKREKLQELGLIEPVGVDVHPDPQKPASAYPGATFVGLGLLTNHTFDLAYQSAIELTTLLARRTRAAGFMRSLMLQRICSSFASGRATAEAMLKRTLVDDEEDAQLLLDPLDGLTPKEAECLHVIRDELSRPEAVDPKLAAVRYFLTEHRVADRTWLEHGCILFSQYYDTAAWLAEQLALSLPDIGIAIYAGAGRSRLRRGDRFVATEREDIKRRVKAGELKLLVATDAACEGLNLQTLGTLVNIDLPWNPSRLEQRLGRIKRFGQRRPTVDMLNLVYQNTRDEDVYRALSKRMQDRFDLFGGLPDTIDDAWIDSQEQLEKEMDRYVHLRKQAQNAFDVRYNGTIDPDKNRWERCSRVFSRRDVIDVLSDPWPNR